MKGKLKLKKGKAVKDQFVLCVGDEGAVLCHYNDGRLANKLFIDSPHSPDVKLIERLTSAYPKSPIYMLVDVIEQNYSQQVLPPVSSFGIKQQIQRRIKRDFQPQDLSNVLQLGRSKEGRKDWIYLFISLANSEPFSKWLEIVLNQKNIFKGVYLLPIEATKLMADIARTSLNSKKNEWELLVLHNKTGGFRIVAFKNGKLIFTRLAQNLIGDNIPDIVVGNMEQEISNTVEYLRRLAFKGEGESKISIVAGAEILQKVDPKALKFGVVELTTPFQLAEKLNLPESVTEKDKFADILSATHFASSARHVLKFTSDYTKKIDLLYTGLTAVKAFVAVIMLATLFSVGSQVFEIFGKVDEKEQAISRLEQANAKLADITARKNKLPKNIDKMLELMTLSKSLESDEYRGLRIINLLSPAFGDEYTIKALNYSESAPASDAVPGKRGNGIFALEIEFDFAIPTNEQDVLAKKSNDFLKEVAKAYPQYKVEYTTEPKIQNQSQFEQVINLNDASRKIDISVIPAKIKISGEFK